MPKCKWNPRELLLVLSFVSWELRNALLSAGTSRWSSSWYSQGFSRQSPHWSWVTPRGSYQIKVFIHQANIVHCPIVGKKSPLVKSLDLNLTAFLSHLRVFFLHWQMAPQRDHSLMALQRTECCAKTRPAVQTSAPRSATPTRSVERSANAWSDARRPATSARPPTLPQQQPQLPHQLPHLHQVCTLRGSFKSIRWK